MGWHAAGVWDPRHCSAGPRGELSNARCIRHPLRRPPRDESRDRATRADHAELSVAPPPSADRRTEPEFTYPARLAKRLSEAFPGLTVKLVMVALPRQPSADLEAQLSAELAAAKPGLVIWGTGASAAGRGDDLDTFIGDVTGTIAKIRAAGADLILMTLQYAPSVARVINLFPYRSAVSRAAEMAGVPVLDRYELMRFWSDTDFLDLDATKPEDRVQVARKLYDCMAEILTKGIVDAVR